MGTRSELWRRYCTKPSKAIASSCVRACVSVLACVCMCVRACARVRLLQARSLLDIVWW